MAAGTVSGARRVTTDDGVTLRAEVAGADDAPLALVLVHGYGARAAVLDPLWRELLPGTRHGGLRLVRYDQRGHGGSGWAGGRSATVDRLGRDLGAVLDALAGPGRVVLAGHSMGGMAVLALLGRRPALVGPRVAGVALLSTAAGPVAAAGRPPGRRSRLRRRVAEGGARLLRRAAPLARLVHPFARGPGRRWLRSRLFAGNPAERTVRAVTGAWRATPVAVLAAYLPGLARYDRRRALAGLRGLPALVVAGAEDATLPARAAVRLARRLGPAARLVLVPGAGHVVPVTHPAEVGAELRALLDRVRERP
ncbi:alpha/beta fold hydrolase [Geodermatophilus marinus]|uniref:alpha/beta fold hydrolase n=1 Tax=Geodermatophilus sp. LHW52908 TaxID=2303986 RepID=UPI00131439E7|nr:alpha/beta hydrolase [Geodermatophilus sp. LHW52908]